MYKSGVQESGDPQIVSSIGKMLQCSDKANFANKQVEAIDIILLCFATLEFSGDRDAPQPQCAMI